MAWPHGRAQIYLGALRGDEPEGRWNSKETAQLRVGMGFYSVGWGKERLCSMTDEAHPSHELVVGCRTRPRPKKVPWCAGMTASSSVPGLKSPFLVHKYCWEIMICAFSGGASRSGAFLSVLCGYCRMEEHRWLIVPRSLRIPPFLSSKGAGMESSKPLGRFFPPTKPTWSVPGGIAGGCAGPGLDEPVGSSSSAHSLTR